MYIDLNIRRARSHEKLVLLDIWNYDQASTSLLPIGVHRFHESRGSNT
jgi:hypothetical protein